MNVTVWMVHAVTCMLKWPDFAASSFCLLPGLVTSSDARIKLSHAFAKTFAEALSPGIYNCRNSAKFLKYDNKRVCDGDDDRMARTSPDPGFGPQVELSGGNAGGLLDLLGVGKTLPGERIAAEEAPPTLLEVEQSRAPVGMKT
jgi:hypothetical protein